MFLKEEDSYAYKGSVYLTKYTVQTVILWNILFLVVGIDNFF